MASKGIGTKKSSGKEYIRMGGFQNVALRMVPDSLVSWWMDQILQIALQKAFMKLCSATLGNVLGILE